MYVPSCPPSQCLLTYSSATLKLEGCVWEQSWSCTQRDMVRWEPQGKREVWSRGWAVLGTELEDPRVAAKCQTTAKLLRWDLLIHCLQDNLRWAPCAILQQTNKQKSSTSLTPCWRHEGNKVSRRRKMIFTLCIYRIDMVGNSHPKKADEKNQGG